MNRAERRQAERQCRRDGHLYKTDGRGEWLPNCVRCGAVVASVGEDPE